MRPEPRDAKACQSAAARMKVLAELLDPAVAVALIVVGLLIALDAVALAYAG